MPSSDEKRQAQQVARRLKARQLKIQTLLEKLPGARQPATTIARPTPRDYSPPAALTLVPFRQSLTCCCTAAHESLSARMRSGHTLLCISLLHTYAYPVCNCPDYHRCSMLGQYSAKSSVAGSAITSFAIPSGGSAIPGCIEVDSTVAALAGRRRADLQVVERGTTVQRKEDDLQDYLAPCLSGSHGSSAC